MAMLNSMADKHVVVFIMAALLVYYFSFQAFTFGEHTK